LTVFFYPVFYSQDEDAVIIVIVNFATTLTYTIHKQFARYAENFISVSLVFV